MNFCRDGAPATEVARQLGCTVTWLLRCKKALGDRLAKYCSVDATGRWLILPSGVRLLAEVLNLRRGVGMPFKEAVRQVEAFDPEAGLYANHEPRQVDWRQRYETVRDEVAFLRERLERSEDRIGRERELMAVERQGMLWERWRWDAVVWQLGRALQAACEENARLASLPGAGFRKLVTGATAVAGAAGEEPAEPARVSLWERIVHPERMRRKKALAA